MEYDSKKKPQFQVPSVSLKCLQLLVTNRDGAMERYCEDIENVFIGCLFPKDTVRFGTEADAYSFILAKARDYYALNGTAIDLDLLKSETVLGCSYFQGLTAVQDDEIFNSFLSLEIPKPQDYFDYLNKIINEIRPGVLADAYKKDEYHRSEVLAKMNDIAGRKRTRRNIIRLSDEYLDKVKGYKYEFIPTGWPELDRLLGGGAFRKGCHLFVAPTGSGKTTFAVGLGFNMSSAGYRVLHINLECLEEQVMAKMAEPRDRYPELKDTLYENYEFWTPVDEIAVSDIKTTLELASRTGHPYDALIIDSLDLLWQDPNLDAVRAEEVNAKALRLIADQYNVVIWVTQQVNGDALRLKPGEEPTMYHIKGAKSVANPMVSVLFMWRSEEQSLEGTADAKLLKNRFGPRHCFRNIKYDNANVDISFADPLEYHDNPTSNFHLYDNR